jgi:hypothetical protein
MEKIYTLMQELKSEDVKLYLLSRKKSKKNIDFNAHEVRLSQQLCENFLENFKCKINDLLRSENFKEFDYNPIFSPENGQVEKININYLQNFDKIQNEINNLPPHYIDGCLEEKYDPWVYILLMNVDEHLDENNVDSEILIFQRITNKKLINEKRNLKKIILGQSQEYIELDNEILVLDDKVDCLCSFYHDNANNMLNENQHMYVMKKYSFELIFGFEEVFKEKIKENISKMKEDIENDPKRVHLIDLDNLYSLCESDYRKLKKLYKIFDDNMFDLLTQKNIDILRNELKIHIRQDTTGLIDVNKKNINPILDIIFDNYLKSPISQNNYRAHSHKEIL